MKKIYVSLFATAFVALMATSCTKTCSCSVRTSVEIADPDNYDPDMYELMKGSSITAETKEETKGKCSDLNQNASQTQWGIRQTTVMTCK